MPASADVLVVLTTAPDRKEAERIGDTLVQEGLAACVNIVPGVTSLFIWEGKVCREGEALLVIKSRADHLEPLVQRVKDLHPYDVPEVVALPVTGGSPEYLDWVRAVGRTASGGTG